MTLGTSLERRERMTTLVTGLRRLSTTPKVYAVPSLHVFISM
jgi:hypothetical protein